MPSPVQPPWSLTPPSTANPNLNGWPAACLHVLHDTLQERSAEAGAYGFFPTTFVVPREYRMFVEEFKRSGGTWIMKVRGDSQIDLALPEDAVASCHADDRLQWHCLRDAQKSCKLNLSRESSLSAITCPIVAVAAVHVRCMHCIHHTVCLSAAHRPGTGQGHLPVQQAQPGK